MLRATLFPSLQLFFRLVKQEASYKLTCSRKSVSQSVRRMTNLQAWKVFVPTLSSLSGVFVSCYCRYGMSVTR